MITRSGNGAQARTALYTVPDILTGPAVLMLRKLSGSDNVSLYGPDGYFTAVGIADFSVATCPVFPGAQFDYSVGSFAGDWEFEFSLYPQGDIAKD